MPSPTFQTVRLSTGRHRSPDEGACIMEVVSMLAEEPFSDAPATACPVIATFLRSYNDLGNDDDRQALLACASSVVGSARPAAEAGRIERCHELALELCRARPAWWRALAWLTRWPSVSPKSAPPGEDAHERGRLCAKLVVLLRSEPDGRARAMALVRELVAIGGPAPSLAGEECLGLLGEVDERFAADVDEHAPDGAAGERPRRGARVVVGHRRPAVDPDVEALSGQ
jgi:hypothetical protein